MVYKVVEVDGRPVAKRSEHKTTQGGRKTAVRRHRRSGTATEEVVVAAGAPEPAPGDRALQIPLMRDGKRVDGLPTLADSRKHLQRVLVTVPWEGLKLFGGEPAIPTTIREPPRQPGSKESPS
jgi:nicotinate phosphoribosyltransferase